MARLSNYTELDRVTQTLKSEKLSVLNDQFIPLLTRLDQSIEYISVHPQYKDSTVYLARFKELQNRAMNLVKLHVVNTLKSATQNVLNQVQGKEEDPDASFTLFYGRFRMHAPRIKALMAEIERRGEVNEDYASLLQDCYSCYVSQRSSLLLEPVGKKVEAIFNDADNDLAKMTREGCVYMIRICNNEHQVSIILLCYLYPWLKFL